MSSGPKGDDASTIVVENVTVEYDGGGSVVRPLDNFSLRAQPGELLVLFGPSGCGKSTLLSIVAGLRSVTSGSVRVADIEITGLSRTRLATFRANNVGYVFRSPNLLPSLNAVENVAVPLLVHGVARKEALSAAEAALDQVGFTSEIEHRPADLATRQQQQVAVARALVSDPPVLVVDEPTARLDHISAQAIITLLRSIADSGRTVLTATHDPRFSPLADRTIDMVPDLAHSPVPPVSVDLEPQQTLFRQGSRGDRVFVLHTGEVEILNQLPDGSEELLATRSAPSSVGELGPLLGFPRSATVRARTTVTATSYSVSDFRSLTVPEPPLSVPAEPSDDEAPTLLTPPLDDAPTLPPHGLDVPPPPPP